MQAIDVVNDRGLPDPELRHRLIMAAYHRGLLLLGCGKSGIRFCPALCVNQQQVTTAFDILADVTSASR